MGPGAVEAIRGALHAAGRPRDAVFVSLLAYAGLRPQEARALRWRHVGERTLTVHAPKTRRHTTQPRSVRLLAPLAHDLREWRMASGRPDPNAFVSMPLTTAASGPRSDTSNGSSGRGPTRSPAPGSPTNGRISRHSFASLLLHEGRSVIYVARQLGHGAGLTMHRYGHVVEELDDAPRITADDAITQARTRASGRILDASGV